MGSFMTGQSTLHRSLQHNERGLNDNRKKNNNTFMFLMIFETLKLKALSFFGITQPYLLMIFGIYVYTDY